MNRKAILLLLAFFMVGCGAVAQAQTNNSSAQSLGSANIVVVGATTTTNQANSEGPTDSSSTPTPQPTTGAQPTQPPAQPTTPASTGNHQCNSGGCQNPWGYVIGLNGNEQGNYLYAAPGGFCGWFMCIANFPNGRGYIVECFDGKMSKSGGISGSCSSHQGEWEPLYQLVSGGPTPTAQPTKTPTPTAQPRKSPTPVPTTPIPTA